MNYAYELLKRNIETPNPYMSKDVLGLMALNFKTNNVISQDEYDEIYLLLNPQPIDPVVTEENI